MVALCKYKNKYVYISSVIKWSPTTISTLVFLAREPGSDLSTHQYSIPQRLGRKGIRRKISAKEWTINGQFKLDGWRLEYWITNLLQVLKYSR